MSKRAWMNLSVSLLTLLGLVALLHRPRSIAELPNRIPEEPPYLVAEAEVFPPPFEEAWKESNPASCGTCHTRVFSQWNGSMMSNSWRDPVWRAAFLLIARLTATDGNCDVPEPPDGTRRAELNPFAAEGCSSRFDFGDGYHTTSRSGSLVDGFCSRCHMPSNYIDNIPLHNVTVDDATGLLHGQLRSSFDPTSDNGTGVAFATDESLWRNTETGQQGLFCGVCHTMVESRNTPYHNYPKEGQEYEPAIGKEPREQLLDPAKQELFEPPVAASPNLGYAVGAGSFRISPHAVSHKEVFGPLANGAAPAIDTYTSEVFGREVPFEVGEFSKHRGFHHAKFQRAEMCSACHDVTNPLTIRNPIGHWAGGFPIERTYTEWLTSRYAQRPGNPYFDPDFKRDCQTCHMQQEFGQAGTAQTLYRDGRPLPPLTGAVSDDGPERSTFYSHHFIGGNAFVPQLIGADVTESGQVEDYPELSVFSYSSADKKSLYYNAYWTNVEARGADTRHARLAWDRLRNAIEIEVSGPPAVAAGSEAPLQIRVTNSGCGHNFPSGFPEGRIAWVAVRAFDLATGTELEIVDSHFKRRSLGVGYLTREETVDPNYPGCDWRLPAGSPDPFSYQFKAVASLGDGCPTLDLIYATPLNLVVNDAGLPIDANGVVIDRDSPTGLPQYRDVDGDGDLFDDSYLIDTRLRPMPHDGATLDLDRYSVAIPDGMEGPIAVTAAVYYQSLEAIVALKFLGNLADTDTDFLLEPCALGGACDRRAPVSEPAVVEGAPPVAMEMANWMIEVEERSPVPPRHLEVLTTYPAAGAESAHRDAVVKVSFSAPVEELEAGSFTLVDASGEPVPAVVDQISDGTWALFPDPVFLDAGRYTARVAAGVCDLVGACLERGVSWSFRVAAADAESSGDSSVPIGFGRATPRPSPPRLLVAERVDDGSVEVTFSEPVLAVNRHTLRLAAGAGEDPCAAGAADGNEVAITISSDAEGITWRLLPAEPLAGSRPYCVSVGSGIYDLDGVRLAGEERMAVR